MEKSGMQKELLSGNSEELIGKLKEKYQIGKTQVYKRLQYLGIKSSKENGKVWIDSRQLQLLDELEEHIKAGNKIETFSKPGEIIQAEKASLDKEAETIHEVHAPNDISLLLRAAQEKAAGNLIAQNLIAAEFTANPHLLDSDLKEQVEQSQKAAIPKPLDPLKYAQAIAQQRKMTALGF